MKRVSVVVMMLIGLSANWWLRPPRVEATDRPPEWFSAPDEYLSERYDPEICYIWDSGRASEDDPALARAKAIAQALSSLGRKITLIKEGGIQKDHDPSTILGYRPKDLGLSKKQAERAAMAISAGTKIDKTGFSWDRHTCYVLAIHFPEGEPRLIQYGQGPIWRSALIPGWGQYHKRHKVKARLFSASEIVLISAALYTDYVAENERQKASANNRWPAIREYHNDLADQFRDVSIKIWLAAAALYVYNIYDAAFTRGTKRYVASSKPLVSPTLSLSRDAWEVKVALHF